MSPKQTQPFLRAQALTIMALCALLIQLPLGKAFAGKDSGGGHVIKGKKVSVDEINFLFGPEMSQQMTSIQIYLNGLEIRYRQIQSGRCSSTRDPHDIAGEYDNRGRDEEHISSLLFSGPETIFEKIKKTKIKVDSKASCYDKDHSAVDASIYADEPNTICISSFSLSKSLNQRNFRAEVQSLLLHEYAHLKGVNEEDATELQNWFYDVAQAWNVTTNPTLEFGPNWSGENVGTHADYFAKAIEEKKYICHFADLFVADVESFQKGVLSHSRGSALRADRLANVNVALAMARVLRDFGCSLEVGLEEAKVKELRESAFNRLFELKTDLNDKCLPDAKLATYRPSSLKSIAEAIEHMKKINAIVVDAVRYEEKVIGGHCRSEQGLPDCPFSVVFKK